MNFFNSASEPEEKLVDNADPHAVKLKVYPRWNIPFRDELEPEYDVTVECPPSCSGAIEECAASDYLDIYGVDRDILSAWPEPDSLSDQELAAIDGSVKHVVVKRSYSSWSNAEGTEWDCDFEFTWVDNG